MIVRSRLVTGLFVVAALFAAQANAQDAGNTGVAAAYQTLQASLQANSAGTEGVDEAAVAAARAAGVPDAQIAGALQQAGRSVDQRVAALLPTNPTDQQAEAAAYAVMNAADQAGGIIAPANEVAPAVIAQSLQNAGVPAVRTSGIAARAFQSVPPTLVAIGGTGGTGGIGGTGGTGGAPTTGDAPGAGNAPVLGGTQGPGTGGPGGGGGGPLAVLVGAQLPGGLLQGNGLVLPGVAGGLGVPASNNAVLGALQGLGNIAGVTVHNL